MVVGRVKGMAGIKWVGLVMPVLVLQLIYHWSVLSVQLLCTAGTVYIVKCKLYSVHYTTVYGVQSEVLGGLFQVLPSMLQWHWGPGGPASRGDSGYTGKMALTGVWSRTEGEARALLCSGTLFSKRPVDNGRYVALDKKSQKRTKKRTQKRKITQKRTQKWKKILKKGKCHSKKCSKKRNHSKKN